MFQTVGFHVAAGQIVILGVRFNRKHAAGMLYGTDTEQANIGAQVDNRIEWTLNRFQFVDVLMKHFMKYVLIATIRTECDMQAVAIKLHGTVWRCIEAVRLLRGEPSLEEWPKATRLANRERFTVSKRQIERLSAKKCQLNMGSQGSLKQGSAASVTSRMKKPAKKHGTNAR